MLAVGVERDDDVGALLQRVVDAGLQRGALAEIDRMAHHGGSRGGPVRRAVGRAVVDHHDMVAAARHVADHARDHPRLVIGGDDHPDPHAVGHRDTLNAST